MLLFSLFSASVLAYGAPTQNSNDNTTVTLIADFTANPTTEDAPLSVQFTDISTGTPTAWQWDFNSDGKVDSNEQNPIYEFKNPGTYTVTLRAGNGDAWSNAKKRITLLL